MLRAVVPQNMLPSDCVLFCVSMQVRFVKMEETHLPQVRDLYNWYIANSVATFHTEPVASTHLLDFIYLNHPKYKSYVILDNDTFAGYCFLTAYKKRQAYDRTAEVTLYLKPEYCHRGIGRIALSKLEQEAVAQGIKNLMAIISFDNDGSVRLFEKAGFAKCGHFRNVGEKFNRVLDVVAYQKEL
jgi:L-amino acid N-acyltransferase YncA